jgi:hypothetical protein
VFTSSLFHNSALSFIDQKIWKKLCKSLTVQCNIQSKSSHIERKWKKTFIIELFSPVSLVWVLKTVRPKIQDYRWVKVDNIPKTKVKKLRYVSDAHFSVEYKTPFAQRNTDKQNATQKGVRLYLFVNIIISHNYFQSYAKIYYVIGACKAKFKFLSWKKFIVHLLPTRKVILPVITKWFEPGLYWKLFTTKTYFFKENIILC